MDEFKEAIIGRGWIPGVYPLNRDYWLVYSRKKIYEVLMAGGMGEDEVGDFVTRHELFQGGEHCGNILLED